MPRYPAQSRSVHPPVLRRELRSGAVQAVKLTLTRCAHDPSELSATAIAYSSLPILQWNPIQNNALATIQGRMDDWQEESRTSYKSFPARSISLPPVELPPRKPLALSGIPYEGPGVPSHDFMCSLIEPVSQLFFLDALVVSEFEWDDTLRQRLRFQGCCSTIRHNGFTKISMDQNWCSHQFDEPRRQADMFGTFLHECAHAWLERNSCATFDDRCQVLDCEASIEHFGITGHGSAFVELASHIQTVAREHIMADIDLGIERAVEFERLARLRA